VVRDLQLLAGLQVEDPDLVVSGAIRVIRDPVSLRRDARLAVGLRVERQSL